MLGIVGEKSSKNLAPKSPLLVILKEGLGEFLAARKCRETCGQKDRKEGFSSVLFPPQVQKKVVQLVILKYTCIRKCYDSIIRRRNAHRYMKSRQKMSGILRRALGAQTTLVGGSGPQGSTRSGGVRTRPGLGSSCLHDDVCESAGLTSIGS